MGLVLEDIINDNAIEIAKDFNQKPKNGIAKIKKLCTDSDITDIRK